MTPILHDFALQDQNNNEIGRDGRDEHHFPAEDHVCIGFVVVSRRTQRKEPLTQMLAGFVRCKCTIIACSPISTVEHSYNFKA